MYRVYLDSNVIIYLVQNTPNAPQVRTYLQAQADSILCSSNLSLLECLVLPFQQANRHLQQRFHTFFQSLELIPARRQVFLRAAQIRAATRLRTPDALHLAFASYGKCDVLLTGDAQMGQKWQPSSLGFTYPAQVVVI
jgi:predicted nucleic acid-binding protein